MFGFVLFGLLTLLFAIYMNCCRRVDINLPIDDEDLTLEKILEASYKDAQDHKERSSGKNYKGC